VLFPEALLKARTTRKRLEPGVIAVNSYLLLSGSLERKFEL